MAKHIFITVRNESIRTYLNGKRELHILSLIHISPPYARE